jgi:hypothetical protein
MSVIEKKTALIHFDILISGSNFAIQKSVKWSFYELYI